jgi:hypothetical protein
MRLPGANLRRPRHRSLIWHQHEQKKRTDEQWGSGYHQERRAFEPQMHKVKRNDGGFTQGQTDEQNYFW